MIAAFLSILIEVNVAASVAIGLVLLTRTRVRAALGPDAAYLMWALVPIAAVAVLIPERTIVATGMTPAGGDGLETVLASTAGVVLFAVWSIGAAAMAAILIWRQRAFLDAVKRGEAGPAVVGFVDPWVVTPRGFEQRFSETERRLMLAHEAVHLERQDARINTLAALARCVCWFNPLAHLGTLRMRADQEMSCDATVVDRRPRNRRVYAETLLKTHLAPFAPPAGCHWPAEGAHPLTERIEMLTHAPLSLARRLAAGFAVMLLAVAGGVTAWAAQPAREVPPREEGAIYFFDFRVSPDAPEILVAFRPVPEPAGNMHPRRPADVFVLNEPPDPDG